MFEELETGIGVDLESSTLSTELKQKVLGGYFFYLNSNKGIVGGNKAYTLEELDEVNEWASLCLLDHSNSLDKGEWPDRMQALAVEYIRFVKYYSDIARFYTELGSWKEVLLQKVIPYLPQYAEAFIYYLENLHQVRVLDAYQLQYLISLDTFPTWDRITGDYTGPQTEEEGSKNAINCLEEVITRARFDQYYRALEFLLAMGGNYKDLLRVDPEEYELPSTWKYCLAQDKYSTILWVIAIEFDLPEAPTLSHLPDLRTIAKQIEAPYSVLMDSYVLSNTI